MIGWYECESKYFTLRNFAHSVSGRVRITPLLSFAALQVLALEEDHHVSQLPFESRR